MNTKRNRRGEGIFWLGLGVFICLLAWQTGPGSFREPGPGFVAFATGLFMAGVGLVMVLTVVFARTSPQGDRALPRVFASVSWSRVFYIFGLLLGYAILLGPLGYILTTLFVLWGLFFDWERKNWLASFLSSLATTGVSYVFFEKFLGLRFPPGIFP